MAHNERLNFYSLLQDDRCCCRYKCGSECCSVHTWNDNLWDSLLHINAVVTPETCSVYVALDWPANSPDLNPIENLWVVVKRKMRNKRPKTADELKATVKETWASITPQQCHKLITSMPRRIEAVIKAKGAPTKY